MDQVQLLLRNAKQMLKIVEATFTDTTFVTDGKSDGEDSSVRHPGTDGHRLADLWTDAFRKLPAEKMMDSDGYEALEALYKVSSFVAHSNKKVPV
jgi:hypothetical protein